MVSPEPGLGEKKGTRGDHYQQGLPAGPPCLWGLEGKVVSLSGALALRWLVDTPGKTGAFQGERGCLTWNRSAGNGEVRGF